MAAEQVIGDVSRISLATAKQLFDQRNAMFVDVRSHEDYEQSHIAGAINLPLREIAKYYADLPRDRQLIFY